jgi:hypothetical protein
MKSSLITVRPKIKQKGFNPDNIGISAFTKEDTGVYNRRNWFQKLSMVIRIN